MRKTFQMIDKNRDGFITLDEINSFQDGVLGDKFGSIMGRAVKPRELFSILDQNNDGKVSYAEFLAGATDKAQLLNEERLKMAFNVLDMDGNGMVSSQELRWRFTSGSNENIAQLNVNEDFWEKMVQDLDSDGDGNITYEEFRVNMAKVLESETFTKHFSDIMSDSSDGEAYGQEEEEGDQVEASAMTAAGQMVSAVIKEEKDDLFSNLERK